MNDLQQDGIIYFYRIEKDKVIIVEMFDEREDFMYKLYLQNEQDIKWNFTKFLVDRHGKVVDRFEPTADFHRIREEIEKLL